MENEDTVALDFFRIGEEVSMVLFLHRDNRVLDNASVEELRGNILLGKNSESGCNQIKVPIPEGCKTLILDFEGYLQLKRGDDM